MSISSSRWAAAAVSSFLRRASRAAAACSVLSVEFPLRAAPAAGNAKLVLGPLAVQGAGPYDAIVPRSRVTI